MQTYGDKSIAFHPALNDKLRPLGAIDLSGKLSKPVGSGVQDNAYALGRVVEGVGYLHVEQLLTHGHGGTRRQVHPQPSLDRIGPYS